MRLLFAIPILLHCCMQAVHAQSTLASSIAQLPSCALSCLIAAVGNSTCSATNTTCVCTNAPLQNQVTLCISDTCTVTEGLKAKNITSTLCSVPIHDKSAAFNALSNTFAVLSGAAILLRISSKLLSGTEFGLDDYFIFFTFASGIPSSVLFVHGLTSNGLGRDIWTLTPTHITAYGRAFFIVEILYFTQVAALKLSLLFFYLRIFPDKTFRKLIWATIIFDVLFGGVFIVGGVFQCRPVSFYWTQWDGEHKGQCLNPNAMAWANAIISILLDVWMLGLAISQLLKLQMHWKRKIGVGLMFAVATFVTVVSILRLQSLLRFANSANPTWDNLAVTQWSTVEINVGIICACMPSMRILLVRMFPKIFGTNNTSLNRYYDKENIRMGTNASVVGRGKSFPMVPIDKKAIMYSKTYDVDVEDETRLVPVNKGSG